MLLGQVRCQMSMLARAMCYEIRTYTKRADCNLLKWRLYLNDPHTEDRLRLSSHNPTPSHFVTPRLCMLRWLSPPSSAMTNSYGSPIHHKDAETEKWQKNGRDSEPSGLGDNHLGAECVELAPQVPVVQRYFDVLVRSLIDTRRRSRAGRWRQHVTLGVITTSGHAGRHAARVITAAERTALTCTNKQRTDRLHSQH